MSIKSLGEPLYGTDHIFAWGEDQILKLYGDGVPEGWVEQLSKVDQALYEAGLPVPAVGEIVELEGFQGQVYERIEGDSMAMGILGSAEVTPETLSRLARIFAETQAEIHAHGAIAKMPFQPGSLLEVIDRIDVLPPDLKEATARAFNELPPGDSLCHGDYHPYNVLMSPRGPVVIDWNNLHVGNPLEDVARSALMLAGVATTEPAHRSAIEHFSKAYLERYFELRPDGQEQLQAWWPIVAAVRLLDNVPEIQEWLFTQIRTGLAL